MKLSNEKIVNSAVTLSKISQVELPIRISYAIAKNIAKIDEELKIYNIERQKLIDKYSCRGEIDTLYIPNENKEMWEEEILELAAIENEVEIIKINMIDLTNSECNVSPAELMAIDYMIEW